VTLFDPSHPREKPCGGGLTGKALSLLPEAPADDPLPARGVPSCRFESGDGDAVDVELAKPVIIVSRREFDGWLLRRALAAGARHLSERVVSVDASGRLGSSTGREERFDVLVGADGASSLVRRTFLGPLPKERLHMAVGWFAPGTVPMTVRFTPGLDGYLWLFPRRDHVAVGISAPLAAVPTRLLLERLRGEIARDFPAFSDESAGVYGHTIPTCSGDPRSIRELAGERWALVGDAAGLVDPITGEGLYSALYSGQLLAETLILDGSPRRYPERLLQGYGRELLKAAALKPRFYAPGFTSRVVRASARSPAVRAVLCDLVLGSQGYLDLKRRLLRAGPRYLLESALSALRVA
jgi:flavin-dependent dehydrogenase